jgi:hypothetical protein
MVLAQCLIAMLAWTQAAQPAAVSQPGTQAVAQQSGVQAGTNPVVQQPVGQPDSPPYSIDRIQKLLAATPQPSRDIAPRAIDIPPADQGRHVDVATRIAIPRQTAEPLPWGAPTHTELMAMSLPRGAFGDGSIRTWGDLGVLMGVSLLNAVVPRLAAAASGLHPARSIKSHVKQAKVNRIRREVRADLAAYEKANGLTPALPATIPVIPVKK